MMTDNTNLATVKIVDFGLVKMLGPGVMTMEPFGTIGYCAPEILLGKPYSLSVDIWSLGCVIYALACQSLPFDDDDAK